MGWYDTAIIVWKGHAVTCQSSIGHTSSHDANSQIRVYQPWTLELGETISHDSRISGLQHSHAVWKEVDENLACRKPSARNKRDYDGARCGRDFNWNVA